MPNKPDSWNDSITDDAPSEEGEVRELYTEEFDQLIETEPEPYLPHNPSFADAIGVHYFVWRQHS